MADLPMERREIAVVGSGFAGSLLARVLAVQGWDVVLLERGMHPRFAIGESTTPLANLSLERLARRYGLADCWHMAAHGRWVRHLPEVRRGLKRGFSFYRHHPGVPFADHGLDAERLLVAASPDDAIADTHWLRADVDWFLVEQAMAAGVEYRDRAEVTAAERRDGTWRLAGARDGRPFALEVDFVLDASGPNGCLARALAIPSALSRVRSDAGLVFGHFDGVRTLRALEPGLPAGPYPDEWAAVHHVLDEGWVYELRFDHGTVSAGAALRPDALKHLGDSPDAVWAALLRRYPTLGAAYGDARARMPLGLVRRMQHRLARAAGPGWAMLPHAYAFVDPLFSTGIAWGLRAVERLALLFEPGAAGRRTPSAEALERYDRLLDREATQIDRLVAGAYAAMPRFEAFAAHAMLYFATVSWAEVRQRVGGEPAAAWEGFLGVGDPVLEPLFAEALRRLDAGTAPDEFAAWAREAIAPRNVAGLADPARRNLYPVDLDVLVDRHGLLGMTRDALVAALPALRGMAPEPAFG